MAKPDISERWIQRLRHESKTAQTYHTDQLPAGGSKQPRLAKSRKDYLNDCESKRTPKDEANDLPQLVVPPTKLTQSTLDLQTSRKTPSSTNASDNITMKDVSDCGRQSPDLDEEKGTGVSAGSMDDLMGGDEFMRAHPKQIWTADQSIVGPSCTAIAQDREHHGLPPAALSSPSQNDSLVSQVFSMKWQLETRPISQEQLVAEVKGIYAGLVMVEARCIEVDAKHASLSQGDPKTQPKISDEQWQALITLHRTLLHMHYDFFLASQHASGSIALRRLASIYAIPARMWRHGIHAFLELLRYRLPASIDHILTFIYLAYSMMTLLYERIPAFEDTWIECLGDLARYRMAIEEDNVSDREVWTGVARQWYCKASDNAPITGRLYHHLAILARPNALQQLFYYSKSLCVEIPFISARESILTLFEPVLKVTSPPQYRLPPFETAFIKAHGILFTGKDLEGYEALVIEFPDLLDAQIGRVTRVFMEQGYYIAIANCAALLDFASPYSVMMNAIAPLQNKPTSEQALPIVTENISASLEKFRLAEKLYNKTLNIVLQRIGDPNILPFLHVALVWLLYVSNSDAGMGLIKDNLPWKALATMLNTLIGSCRDPAVIDAEDFPLPEKDEMRPLPEDNAMRGLLWAVSYFPELWFKNEKIDEDEDYREAASQDRKERILWLAGILFRRLSWLKYNGRFSEQEDSHPPTY